MSHSIEKIIQNKEFTNHYRELLTYRLTFASLELEGEDGPLNTASQALKIDAQLNAMNYVFSCNQRDYHHIAFLRYACQIEKLLTEGEYTNFRKMHAEVNGSSRKRSEPYMINSDLLNLQDDYEYNIANFKKKLIDNNNEYNEELDDELFRIIALYHIRFLLIHPFGDGNGRCARIIMTKALYDNNKAPCIITEETKRQYCDYIENNDVEGMAKFLKKLSNYEYNNIMLPIYEKINIIESKNNVKL